ncbi:tRNA-specific adenosine deaminase TAD3 isoform X2 [Magnolia sinica]|uniref:tRNA-specific adenosine deaminase TAD3 isoform X2 n=1 Tax=Magnolia sinica TaxID=86752 RepID=UPI00265840FD|nr:tRNA-specific adenosine deaminase TAD3 isoform X2 [Magnolia sinica]
MNWQILHIPEKAEHSKQQSTVDIFASQIEPKLANTLVRKLNQVSPLENLRHVKRVRKVAAEGRKVCSFIKGGMGRTVQALANFLSPTDIVAIKLTKSGHLGGQVVNAAVIVDPSIRQVIASASDQTCLWPGPPNKSSLENFNCIRCAEIIPSHHSDATEATSNGPPHLNCMNDDQTGAYSSVSCLHPWGWAGQLPYTKNTLVKCGNSFSWHPLRHAALVAIEYAAARDMQLFPSLEPSESQSSQMDDHLESSSMSLPAKRQKTQLSSDNNMVSDASMNELPSELMRPYLCTGYDIYLVWEPCTMCAMALVHQRIRRIFYAFPNPNAGALGSVHRLQGEKSLNHHYAVFRVLLPKEVLEELTTMDSKP